MKKLSLFILTLLFSATCVWADVSVTEKFTRVVQTGASGNTGSAWTGDVCGWQNVNARRKSSDQINSALATWITVGYTTDETPEYVPGYIKTTNLEGGIKEVSFKYAQFGAEAATTLKWRVSAIGETTSSDVIERDGDDGGNGGTSAGLSYIHTFNYKGNAQLEIYNASVMENGNNPATGKARLLVGDVTITPYLLYRNKDVTVGLKQRGYANDGAQDFINNTGGEGSITYTSDDTSIATVDEENGVITPVGVGTTTITATWSEGASTTYTLHVVDGIIAENFSKVVQTGQTAGADWHGDLWDWSVAYVRRGEADTLGLNPRIQATAMRSNAGSTIISANAIEGGVKHLAFDWRQWASATTPLTFNVYYSADTENWGAAVATQAEDAVAASTPHTFNEDIDDGAKGNAYLKIEYTSGAGVAVMGALKITPYLLYTTKAATLDTRNGLTFTNNDLINNTTGDAVEYSIAPTGSGATIDAGTGEVTVTDATEGTFTVTAEWGNVSTTYTLTVVSRIATTASYSAPAMHVGLDAISIYNPFTYTPGYDGTIAYSSSNTSVAEINASTGAITVNGVGQTTITATLQQTENYKATSASYILYVRNNNGARVERFQNVTQPGVVGTTLTDWTGDLFTWQAQYQVRRGTNDTIHAETTKHQGTSIGIQDPTGTPKSSILQSKDVIEGGIKYLSFYWMQWGAASNCTRRIVVYADGTKIGEQEHPNGTEGRSGDEFLLGINNAMKSNKQLVIKNESYKGSVETLADNACRIVLDNIYITPWLLYTNKDKQIMRIGGTYTRTPNINNTAGETGELSYISSNTEVATVNSSGQVTAVARGEATITAKFKWNETDSVTTSYKVEVFPVNCETFSQNATEHTYQTAEYGNSYTNPEPVVEDKCTWYAWLGGVVPSNYEPNVAVIRAPHTDEQGPAYIRSGELTGGIGSMTFDWNLVANENNINWDIRVLVNGREVKQLGNDDLSMTVLLNFGQITIDDINEPGDFVITFENHSTVTSGEYTNGNKARFVIDNVTWTSYSGAKTLYDNIDNSSWLTDVDGESRDVNTNRTLVADAWNTLCLPFAISKSTDLGGADVQEMNSAELSGDELEIGFNALAGDELAAGTPYLVKPTSDVSLTGFTGKTIEATPSSVTKGIVTLQGIFSPTTLYKDDNSTLFVGVPDGEGNNLFYPGATGDLNGFRAYFKIGSSAAPAPALRRARFVVNAQQTPTDAEEITNHKSQITNKVIIDGQLIIIRDGVKYNAMGQQIQ